VTIIKYGVTKYILFASFLAIVILFNNSKVFANEEVLLAKGYIDSPLNGSSVIGEINVNGWFLDASGVSRIEVLIDGKSMGEAKYGISRTDVSKAFPEYQNANSGYQLTLNTKNLTNGQHKLVVRETGKNGTTKELERLLVNVQNLPAKGYIDTPTNGSTIKGEIAVTGWYLDVTGISKIEVFVDGKKMGDAQYGISRTDVGKAFPEYQNANSGYKFTLNTKNLTNGQHTLRVRGIGKNGTTKDLESKVVNVLNVQAKGYIDTPMTGSTVKGEISVTGWLLDDSGVSKIEVLVDGKSMGEAQYGISRTDVSKAFPEYQNANSGYQFTLNTKNLSNGQHTLTVRETGNNGTTKKLENLLLNVQNLLPKGYIDTPMNASTVKGGIDVTGWFLDASGVSKLEVLVDGKSMGEAKYGISRTDVSKAFPEYQNANSGYQFTLNTMNLINGQHRLTVKETGENGITKVLESLVVIVQNVPAKGYIDTPANGSVVKGEIAVNGWFLDDSGVAKIEVLVDGKSMGEAKYGISRPDVGKAFPEYKNANAGYQFTLNTKKLTNGQHTLTVRETGKNGTTKQLENLVVNVQNIPAKGYIDTPSAVKGQINVIGWFLDVSGISKIEVFVDGRSMGEAQYGSARPDVKQAFPEYQNANAGYKITLNSLQFSDGQHTLVVKGTGGNGSTHTLNGFLYVYNENPYLQIDLRKPANITANDIISFFNQKRPDSPLKDYAQSFIDAQNKYGVNAQYLVAHAIWETGWDGSNLRNYKHNLFGYSAYNVCPFTCGFYFPTGGDSINFEGYIVRRDYLNETGSFYNGPTLTGMNVRYATDPNWKNGIANLMQSIKPFDANSYFQTGILAGSSVAAPSFGRDIPAGKPYPTDIIINNTVNTYATVMDNGLKFRNLPYVSTSTLIKSLPLGTVVKVLGYNTDVRYVPGVIFEYPYDNRWYRVLVAGQEGWLYGGGFTFHQ
jgi:hypothetical protein